MQTTDSNRDIIKNDPVRTIDGTTSIGWVNPDLARKNIIDPTTGSSSGRKEDPANDNEISDFRDDEVEEIECGPRGRNFYFRS